MSHTQTILNLLRRVHERRRRNHILKEVGASLALALPVPVLFKLWDLWAPMTGRTVAILLGLWAIAAIAVIAFRVRTPKTTLLEEAAALDRAAGLNDEIRTAFWFSEQSQKSDWIDAQLQRAAKTAQNLNVDRFYPGSIPRAVYVAAGLFLALAGLNFLPVTGNHNWFMLDAAPAFSLNADQRDLIDQAQDLLTQAERLGEQQLVERLQQIIQDLQQGRISVDEALAQLQQLRTELEAGNLDIGAVREGLDEVAGDLARASTLEKAAQALSENDLTQAAEEFRAAAEQVPEMTEEQKEDLQQSLEQAAENEQPGLEELAQEMKEAAEALENGNDQLSEEELKQIAEQLEALLKEMQAQGLKNEAAETLDSLEDALREGQEEEGELADSEMQPGEPGEKGDPAAKRPAGAVPKGQGSAGGEGQNPSGIVPDAPAPREGDATQLDVVLQQEELVTVPLDEQEMQEIEEKSRQERSKLDYRNVTSELTPAQKDALNQTSIPWEYRQLIKQYFEAIRPAETK